MCVCLRGNKKKKERDRREKRFCGENLCQKVKKKKNPKSDIKRNKLTVNQVEPNTISYNALTRVFPENH